MGDPGFPYELIDAVAFQKIHPTTFELPDELNRTSIAVGEWAKLMFKFPVNREPAIERMWVRITEVTPTGYIGMLDNDPSNVEFLRRGDVVQFEARHVINILPPRVYFDKLKE